MTIVYIHGATASGGSFNYIREHILVPSIVLEYESEDGFFNNLKHMYEKLIHVKGNLFFVGHSLGGIYCLSLADHFKEKTSGGVTISTPYGGSEIASFAKYFAPFSILLKEITPYSNPISYAKKLPVPANWTNIVTTKGNSPWIPGANDGVVTIESQRYHKGMNLVDMHTNHYEVIIHPDTIKILEEKIIK
jgi:pimeloyl-ACP methyl ester carboxylesterase